MNGQDSITHNFIDARLAMALIVALTLGVSACGGGPEEASAPAAQPPAGETAPATGPENAPPPEPGAAPTAMPPEASAPVPGPVAAGAPVESGAGSDPTDPRNLAPVEASNPTGQADTAVRPEDMAPVASGGTLDTVALDGPQAPQSGSQGLAMIASTAKWDKTQNEVRVVLAYDAERKAFVGSVANSTKTKLCGVSVTVYLEDGKAFGPTAGADLAASGTSKIELPAQGTPVKNWAARADIAPCGIGG